MGTYKMGTGTHVETMHIYGWAGLAWLPLIPTGEKALLGGSASDKRDQWGRMHFMVKLKSFYGTK